ncbi:MAG: hypothetical protein RL033_6255 [Pseudomonadota bacterium]|jgi:hypothetical protein
MHSELPLPNTQFAHHAETLARVRTHFAAQPEVSAVLLGGSIAHGFASAQSDVDIAIVVPDEQFQDRLRRADTCFFSRELCTYPEGYVDGKYISEAFLDQVAQRGSEPARFAFQDVQVVFNHSPTLLPRLTAAARYPSEEQAERIRRFQAQCSAWHWYTSEARKRQDLPLLRTAVSKLSLFGGRLILAHNQLLYPYHKWFLRVLEQAPQKPPELLPLMQELARDPQPDTATRFVELLRAIGTWPTSSWGPQFMIDSELTWLHGNPPIDDL